MAYRALSFLSGLIFPVECALCSNREDIDGALGLCRGCWNAVDWIDPPYCPRCGKPYASDSALSHSPEHICGDCRSRPPHYDRAISAAVYGKGLAEAIHLFKYSGKTKWSAALGGLLIKGVSRLGKIDAVLPVPLHPRRLRQREFNQSFLLAAEVSRSARIPLQGDNLLRVRWTRPQIELSGEERRKNVRGAFGLRWPDRVQKRSLLLVDDVYTTGATVNECARVLKRAGADAVYVITVARMT